MAQMAAAGGADAPFGVSCTPKRSPRYPSSRHPARTVGGVPPRLNPAWRLRTRKNAWVTGAPTSSRTHPHAPLPTHAQVVMDPVADLYGHLPAAGSRTRARTRRSAVDLAAAARPKRPSFGPDGRQFRRCPPRPGPGPRTCLPGPFPTGRGSVCPRIRCPSTPQTRRSSRRESRSREPRHVFAPFGASPTLVRAAKRPGHGAL